MIGTEGGEHKVILVNLDTRTVETGVVDVSMEFAQDWAREWNRKKSRNLALPWPSWLSLPSGESCASTAHPQEPKNTGKIRLSTNSSRKNIDHPEAVSVS